ncbi:MAG TPA: ABC transporter ATP-binding protein [Polyangia bacterium]|nr:ABC transporter ATP-binding protein [Polyangia bacterium]
MSSVAEPVVALRGLSKRYGAVEALRGLDLTVERGQVYGFLGRNGAGKSTALRVIMGITHPSGGQVALFGQPLVGEDPAVRRRIGYVAQEQSFYGWMTPLRLGQFVAGFYPTWDDVEYRRLLALLEVPADRRIATFSGGNHAKLALAVALAHRPELLVLDEPTAGMDAVARREFLELVRAQAQRAGRTTLFSSHLIDEVELAADTVGIVDGGRMLWEGPPADLQATVRRLRGGPEAALPEAGALVLEDHRDQGGRTVLVRAVDPAVLEGLAAGGWEVSVPSLEDIFVAMVRKPIAY